MFSPSEKWDRRFARGSSPARLAVLLAFFPLLLARSPAAEGGAGSPAASAPQPVAVGFIIPDFEDSWWLRLWFGGAVAARENGFRLLRCEARSTGKVLDGLRDFAALGADAVVIGVSESRRGRRVKDECRRLGLKLYAIGTRLEEEDGTVIRDVPFVGLDAARVGRDVGNVLMDEAERRGWPPEECALMLMTVAQPAAAMERSAGVRESALGRGFAAGRVVEVRLTSDEYTGSAAAAGLAADSHPEVGRWLVGGAEDEAVIGAVRALEERGYNYGSIIAVGVDAGFAAQKEFENPRPTGFFATFRAHGIPLGRMVAKRAFHWVRDGEAPPPEELGLGYLVTRDNYVREMKLRLPAREAADGGEKDADGPGG